MFAFTHVQFFQQDQRITGQAVLIDHGVIQAIMPESALPKTVPTVNGQQQLLVPGFIDTQVNGGGGIMFNQHPTAAGITTLCQAHWSGGTTQLMPTLITDSPEVMAAAVQAVGETLGKGVLGIHLEGPHLNPVRCGVHSTAYIRPFDANTAHVLEQLAPEHYLLTVAPEQMATGQIQQLATRGIRVSAGHTAANAAQMQQAIAEGLCAVTHLYNAMTPMTGREPGVVGAALADDRVYCGIIIDHVHLHPLTAQLAIQQKARGKVLLVTDAMATVGTTGRHFQLYDETISVEAGRCVRSDGTLAGSALDMITAVRNCVTDLGIALPEALRMASLYPANFLGLGHQFGRVQVGYQADLLLLDQPLHVQQTWVAGECRYVRQGELIFL